MLSLGLAPSCDPSPMTREGTRALIEAFQSLRLARMVEVGGGGRPGSGGTTTLPSPGPKKTKSVSRGPVVVGPAGVPAGVPAADPAAVDVSGIPAVWLSDIRGCAGCGALVWKECVCE